MNSVVNLNRFRKAKQREEAERGAAANRAAHGRTKTERRKDTAEQQRRDRELDGNKLE